MMGFDPFPLGRDALFAALEDKGFLGIDERTTGTASFSRLSSRRSSTNLHSDRPYIIYGWPASISTMAKKRVGRPNMVERFELYMDGLELANGYTELTDPGEQRKRFDEDNCKRARLGKRQFARDDAFLNALGMIRT